MPRSLFPLALAGLVLAGASVRSEDWPEFRGPTGQGHARADGLVTQWSSTKNVVWKSDVPGSGWSSPVVVAGRVYLTSAVAIPGTKDLSLRALCVDAKDGKTLWSQEVF